MKQPEALRLAEALKNPMRWHELTDQEADDSADELVRLHEANQSMLEALKEISAQTYDPWTNGAEAKRIAIAAIAKGEQQ